MRLGRSFFAICPSAACLWLVSCGDTTSELISRDAQGAVACHANAECSTEKPVCNTETGRCGPCVDDVSCTPQRLHCDVGSGACVECLATADCSGPDRKL